MWALAQKWGQEMGSGMSIDLYIQFDSEEIVPDTNCLTKEAVQNGGLYRIQPVAH